MPQIVQARVWAQGLTIGIIIAAGIMTHKQRASVYEEEDERRVRHLVCGCGQRPFTKIVMVLLSQPPDHSWQDILEQEQKEQQRIAASIDSRSRPS